MKRPVCAAFIASLLIPVFAALPSAAQVLHRITVPLKYSMPPGCIRPRKSVKPRHINSSCTAQKSKTAALAAKSAGHGQKASAKHCLAAQQISMAEKIALAAQQVAARQNSVGMCYAGVCNALRPLGVRLCGQAAWMARDQLESDGRFKTVPLKSLKPGDILVHDKSKTHPYGHIAVYLGNEKEASDHVQKLITTNGNYGQTIVFRFSASGV